jgi:uncharacterized phage protein gp47/JayE
MSYIEPPWETDPDVLIADALDYLTAAIPGWVPHEGNIEVWLIEALGNMVAVARDVGSAVPKSIFRYYGQSLISLPAVEAASATVPTTWTAIDNAGYTIEAGTVVGFQRTGDVVEPFEVVETVVIAPGSLTTAAGEVEVRALNEGADANGLGGALMAIDSLAWVNTITAVGTSAGGADAETDDEYLDRLAAELQLLSPRPILPPDFAVLARRVAGVHRAVAIDNYEPPEAVPNVTRVNANPGLTAALAAFVPEDEGRTLAGTGIPGGATILAYVSPTQVTMSANATSGGVDTVTMGERIDQERMVAVGAVDEDGNVVPAGVKTAIKSLLESEREVNFIVHVISPTYTAINVDFTVTIREGYDTADVLTRAEEAVEAYLDPALFAGGAETPPVWRLETTIRHLELAHVLYLVGGVDDVTALTINGVAADLVLPGRLPLPTAGAIVGTAA